MTITLQLEQRVLVEKPPFATQTFIQQKKDKKPFYIFDIDEKNHELGIYPCKYCKAMLGLVTSGPKFYIPYEEAYNEFEPMT